MSSSDVPQVLATISRLMKKTGVSWCVVGDVLLAHYLVPQVIRDIEICVQSENFKDIESRFDLSTDFCFRFRHPASNSGYSGPFSRFSVRGMNQCFCIVTGTQYGLDPKTFSGLLNDPNCEFPLLPLPYYVQGLANVVTRQSKENAEFVAQIEHLIDGMDIDEDWCCKYLDGPAQGYVRGKSTLTTKKNRMGSHPKYDGGFTMYIHDERERQTALRVIGRTMGSLGNTTSRTFPIQIMSDLHLEFEFPFRSPGNMTKPGYQVFDCQPCAPILALLGDIGLVSHDGLFNFLRRQLLKYEKILYVMGNHEFYRSSYEYAKARMKLFADEIKKQRNSECPLGEFIFLDQTRHDLDANTTVLGCTLWSNIPSTASKEVGICLNDFRQIRGWTVETHNAAHVADSTWLDKECEKIRAEEPDRSIIVLTHYAPAMSGTSASRYEKDSNTIQSAFATDMSSRSCWGPPVKVWVFGHTHYCCDFVKSGVRLVSNQRGYEGMETPYSSFRDDFVLHL